LLAAAVVVVEIMLLTLTVGVTEMVPVPEHSPQERLEVLAEVLELPAMVTAAAVAAAQDIRQVA
jgi:hypothetical protein